MRDPVRLPSGLICDRDEIQAFVIRTERMYPTFEPITVEQLQEQLYPLDNLAHNIRSLHCPYSVHSSIPC